MNNTSMNRLVSFTTIYSTLFVILFGLASSVWSYTNITPAEVHSRLVKGDTLLLLDVREVSEYRAGHIAEPTDQLPLTPVNMPMNSNVLSAEYHRLPKNIDIIVYCAAGGRSASASSFLESNGFTRIFNMTGGFFSWTFERRNNGFGDHSGQWIHSSDIEPVTISCSETGDTSKIIFQSNALPETDSIYVEIHFASHLTAIPPNVPESDLKGLFRITALDRFGLLKFVNDSLSLADTVHIRLFPEYPGGSPTSLTDQNMTAFVPDEGWRTVRSFLDSYAFHRNELILRRWYNVEGFVETGITDKTTSVPPVIDVFPNPFNSSIHIIAPTDASIFIYDLHGRLIKQQKSRIWSPNESIGSGIYFIKIRFANEYIIKRVVYLK